MKCYNEIIRQGNLTMKPVFILAAILLSLNTSFGQEGAEKIKPKVRLNYTKYMDGRTELKVRAYYKVESQTEPCVGASIGFYRSEEEEQPYRIVPMDENGEAMLTLNDNEITAFEDSANHYHFFARIEKNEKYKEQGADVEIWNSKLDVSFIKGDSVNRVRAVFTCSEDTSGLHPCQKVPLKFSVKRAFSLLPIGGDFIYTGEDGIAEVEFPNDIPGDEKGELTVIVRLEEDDLFGTVRYEGNVGWGAVVHPEAPVAERSLVGSRNNAPLFMVIGINGILFGIWGYLIYIVVGLIKIKKLGRQET